MAKIRALVLKSLCETLNKGAYSNLQLKSSLLDDSLTSKDKALYKQLYFGTLERLKTLDAVIAKFSKMKLNKMSPQLKNALRLGAFQILFCERIFDTEAVNITVELIKKKMPSASGFVNAVLRNIQRNKEGLVASLINPCERYSVSESIVDMLKKEYGKEKAYAFMEGLFENIPITAAVNTLKTDAAALSDILEKQDIEAKINNGYLELYAHTSIENTPAYKEGLFHLQGEASQNAIKLLETEPGMTVIDMCSAPGSKSFTAAYIMKNSLISTITLLSTRISYMLGGSVVIETVFSLTGCGELLVDAIFARDYAIVQCMVFIYALIVMAISLITDIIYSFIDPRVTL